LPASYSGPSAAKAPAPPATGAQTKEPGMLAQMAATAGSVAIGSTIGHGISSMLFGGSTPAPAAEQPVQQQTQAQQPLGAINCEDRAKDFSKCIEKADLNSCGWYLEQLKACQAAAAPY